MRTVAFIVVTVALAASGCPKAVDCGGLSEAEPDVAEGKGTATRSDGVAFSKDAFWSPGTNASIDVGTLDMKVANDETGSSFDQLVADGALPICVPLAERAANAGAGNFVETGAVTDASHTGHVLIIKNDGTLLTARFAMDLKQPDGSTLSFTDGKVRARRQ